MTQLSPRSAAPAAQEAREDPLWYKDAIIYHVHVKAFYDSDNASRSPARA